MKRSVNQIKPVNHQRYKNVNIYTLVEAVNSVIKPGEEDIVPYIVSHILENHHARFGNA